MRHWTAIVLAVLLGVPLALLIYTLGYGAAWMGRHPHVLFLGVLILAVT